MSVPRPTLIEALGLRQVEQALPRNRLEVGRRPRRASFGQALALVVAQVHAVGEYRALAQQLEVVIDVQVTLLLREQRLDPVDFLEVFRQCVCMCTPGCLSNWPARVNCSGVLVGANRG